MAILTKDTDRFHSFYGQMFDTAVWHDHQVAEGVRMSFVDLGPTAKLNVFEVAGNDEAEHQTPMFGRGRIDHLGLEAASKEAFDTIRDRLMAWAPATVS